MLEELIVFEITKDGFYAYDESGTIFVYTDEAIYRTIGEKVVVVGTYDQYYGQPQIINPVVTLISIDNPLLTPTVKTLSEIVAFDQNDK